MDACMHVRNMAHKTHMYGVHSTDPQETVSSSGNKSTGSETPGPFPILVFPLARHPLQIFVLWSPHSMEAQKVSHTVLHYIHLHCTYI